MPRIPDKPRAKGSYRRNAAAAQRRLARGQLSAPGPHKGLPTPLVETQPAAVRPGAPTQRRQPRSGATPGPVLGAVPGVANTSIVPGATGVHSGTTPVGLGRAAPDAARMNKRFTVGFTQDGRIVHLYGNDVPADQRRQVLPKRRG